MSTETPRQRNRAAKVLQAAYPDLDVREVRRLLTKAQEVKRGERDYAFARCDDGTRLEIDSLKKQ